MRHMTWILILGMGLGSPAAAQVPLANRADSLVAGFRMFESMYGIDPSVIPVTVILPTLDLVPTEYTPPEGTRNALRAWAITAESLQLSTDLVDGMTNRGRFARVLHKVVALVPAVGGTGALTQLARMIDGKDASPSDVLILAAAGSIGQLANNLGFEPYIEEARFIVAAGERYEGIKALVEQYAVAVRSIADAPTFTSEEDFTRLTAAQLVIADAIFVRIKEVIDMLPQSYIDGSPELTRRQEDVYKPEVLVRMSR